MHNFEPVTKLQSHYKLKSVNDENMLFVYKQFSLMDHGNNKHKTA